MSLTHENDEKEMMRLRHVRGSSLLLAADTCTPKRTGGILLGRSTVCSTR